MRRRASPAAAGSAARAALAAAAGGGGGGYAGGAGGGYAGAGGGGSFLASYVTSPELVTGGADNSAYSGNGYVTIDFVSAAVPEPGSLGLAAAALLGLGLIRRRRRG